MFLYRSVYHNRHMDWWELEFAPASNRPSRHVLDNLLYNKMYSSRKQPTDSEKIAASLHDIAAPLPHPLKFNRCYWRIKYTFVLSPRNPANHYPLLSLLYTT